MVDSLVYLSKGVKCRTHTVLSDELPLEISDEYTEYVMICSVIVFELHVLPLDGLGGRVEQNYINDYYGGIVKKNLTLFTI